jgi:hypothetical protein
MKRVTLELAICEPDAEITALVSGGLLLRKNFGTFGSPENQSIGWAAPSVGDDPTGNGVALEVWSFAIKDGRRAATLPYFYWVFPYARLRQSGDRVIENGMLATTFEGYGLGNEAFGNGLDGRWEFPVATERAYSYARASWAPTGLKGFYTWYPVNQATVNNKALTTNVATLTTSAAHGFTAGQQVTVATVGAPFDGTYTILATPLATTFTYAKTNTDVTSAVATGTATVGPGYTAVTDLAGDDDTTTFNVPGSQEYNADQPLDFVIPSDEDPII